MRQKRVKLQYLCAAALGVMSIVGTASAATVSVNTDNSTVLTTTGLTQFATNGDDMDGMIVTAQFASGASQQLVWGTTGVNTGGATGSLFSLTLSGDTFTQSWNLTNLNQDSALTNLTINAAPGNTVFDIIATPDTTPGSASGLAFVDRSASVGGSISVLYSNPVALTGEDPLHDLYALLMADFATLNDGGLLFDTAYLFGADTDNSATRISSVPLPGALPLLMIALGMLGIMLRGRQAGVPMRARV